jgi:hypothetical protein
VVVILLALNILHSAMDPRGQHQGGELYGFARKPLARYKHKNVRPPLVFWLIGFNNSIPSYIERLHYGNLANFFAACCGDAANLNISLQNYQL